MESEGELLKAERLYSIVVNERVLEMLEETENENEKKDVSEQRIEEEENKGEKVGRVGVVEKNRLFSIDKRTLEPVEKEELQRNVERNFSEGSNGWMPENSKINGKITLSTTREFKQGLEEGLEKGKQERGLRKNCMSSKLLIRTQQWKKDGALLVRTLNPVSFFLLDRPFSFSF